MSVTENKERKDFDRESQLLVSGIFREDDISAVILNENLIPHPNLSVIIEKEWEPKAARGWKPLSLLHLESYTLGPDNPTLYLNFNHTNGKDFIGGSKWETWKDLGLDLDLQKIPSPLVTSTVLITSDNKMVVQERGTSAHQGGNIDALGGHIDPKLKESGGDTYEDSETGWTFVDILGSARRELKEETGLSDNNIIEIVGLGLIHNRKDTSHYAFPCVAETNLTSKEVLDLQRDEEEKKQVNLRVVDIGGKPGDNPNHVANLIRDYLPNVDPEARLTIALARRYHNGNPMETRQYTNENGIIDIFNRLGKNN